VWNGLIPGFCDCLPDSLTLDPDHVERNLSPRTAAICPVYVYGLPPEMDALLEVGARHGLPVYFDSAQGLGAEYRGRKAGTFGRCEIFSLIASSAPRRPAEAPALPLYSHMTQDQLDRVCQAVERLLA
jgi:dTDP-4-amino-4,6-dideoxygalactose transaminase